MMSRNDELLVRSSGAVLTGVSGVQAAISSGLVLHPTTSALGYAGIVSSSYGVYQGAKRAFGEYDAREAVVDPLVKSYDISTALGSGVGSSASSIIPSYLERRGAQVRDTAIEYAMFGAAAGVTSATIKGADKAVSGAVKGMSSRKALSIRPTSSKYYSVLYRAKLRKGIDYPGFNDRVHFKEANKQLYNTMSSDEKSKRAYEEIFPGLYNSISPNKLGLFPSKPPTKQGLTWHHIYHEEGVLELIPRSHHRSSGTVQKNLHPNNKGGMKVWGGGR